MNTIGFAAFVASAEDMDAMESVLVVHGDESFRNLAKDYLAAMHARAEPAWQDICTAPTDRRIWLWGRRVIIEGVYEEDEPRAHNAVWDDDKWFIECGGDCGDVDIEVVDPTHWMEYEKPWKPSAPVSKS